MALKYHRGWREAAAFGSAAVAGSFGGWRRGYRRRGYRRVSTPSDRQDVQRLNVVGYFVIDGRSGRRGGT